MPAAIQYLCLDHALWDGEEQECGPPVRLVGALLTPALLGLLLLERHAAHKKQQEHQEQRRDLQHPPALQLAVRSHSVLRTGPNHAWEGAKVSA